MKKPDKQFYEQQTLSEIAFFVTWRTHKTNKRNEKLSIFNNSKDAAEFIVKSKKDKSDVRVSMAIRNIK